MVDVLDLKDGAVWNCQQCPRWEVTGIPEDASCPSRFWRKNNLPNNLVPAGWKMHWNQDQFPVTASVYMCPKCYRKNIHEGYIMIDDWLDNWRIRVIHHRGQVEEGFLPGGIPDHKGGKKKRTRRRRKKRRKSRRRKRKRRR